MTLPALFSPNHPALAQAATPVGRSLAHARLNASTQGAVHAFLSRGATKKASFVAAHYGRVGSKRLSVEIYV
jgi:hypothetical protein